MCANFEHEHFYTNSFTEQQNNSTLALSLFDKGLHDCEMLRISYVVDKRLTVGGEVVSLTYRPRFLVLTSVRDYY
jgi:hypothetical protein